MKAKPGYKKQKPDSPAVGRWLKRYWERRTCRKRKAKGELKMIPMIPEGCERFRQDDIDRWEFQFPGCGDDAEWDLVESILLLSGPTPESRLLWRDLCNAARCAWLDEAERVVVGDDPFQYEKDYAHCLAWAEAWAREAKG